MNSGRWIGTGFRTVHSRLCGDGRCGRRVVVNGTECRPYLRRCRAIFTTAAMLARHRGVVGSELYSASSEGEIADRWSALTLVVQDLPCVAFATGATRGYSLPMPTTETGKLSEKLSQSQILRTTIARFPKRPAAAEIRARWEEASGMRGAWGERVVCRWPENEPGCGCA